MDRSAPADGDVSICFECDAVSLFDAASPGGARIPKRQEILEILADPVAKMMGVSS